MLEKIGHYAFDGNERRLKEFFCDNFCGDYFEFRNLEENKKVMFKGDTLPWHQDGCGTFFQSMIVWSNRESTEFCLDKYNPVPVITFSPGSIVWFLNSTVFHRSPKHQSPDRCFVRLYRPTPAKVQVFREWWNMKTGCHNATCDGIASLGACGP